MDERDGEDIFKLVKDRDIKRDLKVVMEAVDDFKAIEDRNRLPEAVFKEHFVPMFTDKNMDPNLRAHLWTNYIAIAGSYNSELDIVGENSEVLFTCPAVGSSAYREGGAKGADYGVIMTEYNNQRNRHVNVANAFFINATNEKLVEEAEGVSVTETSKTTWDNIFKRYNVKPIGYLYENRSSSNNSKATESSGDIDDYIVYD